jgi:hypothetical protein
MMSLLRTDALTLSLLRGSAPSPHQLGILISYKPFTTEVTASSVAAVLIPISVFMPLIIARHCLVSFHDEHGGSFYFPTYLPIPSSISI